MQDVFRIELSLLLSGAVVFAFLAATRNLWSRQNPTPAVQHQVMLEKVIINNATRVRVLVIGGSYGGLAAALNLHDLSAGKTARFAGEQTSQPNSQLAVPTQIKIVDERDGYYHLIGSPLAFAESKYAAKAWTRFTDLPALRAPNLSFTQGSVLNVDCERKIAKIKDLNTGKEYEESYDYLVASSGLRRAFPTVPQSRRREEYLAETGDHISKIKNAKEGIVVVGGGAVGVEMAAELKLVEPTLKVTLIHSRSHLLSSEPLPDTFKERALSVLQEKGVEVVLNDRVTDTTTVETADGSPLYKLTLKDGTTRLTSHVIWAISRSIPTSSYLPAAALDAEGHVRISATLNFLTGPNAQSHFAIGDIASWTGIKRCGGAMHMGHFAAVNIHQQLLQSRLGTVPKFSEIQKFPAIIGLAVGTSAVSYTPEDGTNSGEDVRKMYFGDDLGFKICWDYLRLGVDGAN